MAIIKPELDKPLRLSLKFPSPLEKQGKWGLQYLYTLLEPEGVIYLPPIAHDEIQKLHAGTGEPFTLTKSIGQGNQAVWKVERIQPSEPPSEQARPIVAIGAIAPKSTTNGKTVAVMPAAAPTLSTPQSRTLSNQLIAAIAAVKIASAYAKQEGVPLEFTSRDICALAITGGIQVFKEGVY